MVLRSPSPGVARPPLSRPVLGDIAPVAVSPSPAEARSRPGTPDPAVARFGRSTPVTPSASSPSLLLGANAGPGCAAGSAVAFASAEVEPRSLWPPRTPETSSRHQHASPQSLGTSADKFTLGRTASAALAAAISAPALRSASVGRIPASAVAEPVVSSSDAVVQPFQEVRPPADLAGAVSARVAAAAADARRLEDGWRAMTSRQDGLEKRLEDLSMFVDDFAQERRRVDTMEEQQRSLKAQLHASEEQQRSLATQLQEQHRQVVDVSNVVQDLATRPAAVSIPPDSECSVRFTDMLETLAGQAEAVEDLGIMVREELKASREFLATKNQDSTVGAACEGFTPLLVTELPKRIDAQGEAIARLEVLVSKLGDLLLEQDAEISDRGQASREISGVEADFSTGQAAVEEPSAGAQHCQASVPAIGSREPLEQRVDGLETTLVEFRQHLRMLTAAVRHVRDSAAEAFEDRLSSAIGEVQRRVTESLAVTQERVRGLCEVVAAGAAQPEVGAVKVSISPAAASATVSAAHPPGGSHSRCGGDGGDNQTMDPSSPDNRKRGAVCQGLRSEAAPATGTNHLMWPYHAPSSRSAGGSLRGSQRRSASAA